MIMLTFMPNEGHDSENCDYMCMISDVIVAVRVMKGGLWLKTSPHPSPQNTIAPEHTSNTYTSNHANSRHNYLHTIRLQAFRAQQLLFLLSDFRPSGPNSC